MQCGNAWSGSENKSQEVGRERKCKVRFSLTKKNKVFRRSYMKVEVKKLLRAGMMPARIW